MFSCLYCLLVFENFLFDSTIEIYIPNKHVIVFQKSMPKKQHLNMSQCIQGLNC